MDRKSYPAHPRPSCHAVILDGERILMVERGHEPFRGWWGLPGGAVELGETVEEALKREVWEETGIEVVVDRLLAFRDAVGRDPDGRISYHYVILFFLARHVGGSLRAGDDAAQARWVPREEVARLPVVPGVADVIRAAGLY